MAERLITGPIKVAPSMMCADALRFGEHAANLEAAGVHLWHMDVMDGHFVPNVSMALPLLEQFRPQTELPFDVHLMVENNDAFIDWCSAFLREGDRIAVHIESCVHLDRTLTIIRDRGYKPGVAINPHTPPDALRYVLGRLDYVLVMSVNPGYAGQRMVPGSIDKIADTRAMLDRHDHHSVSIEVDGNVGYDNIPGMVAVGADTLVAGTSSLFKKGLSLDEMVAKLNKAVEQGMAGRTAASHQTLA